MNIKMGYEKVPHSKVIKMVVFNAKLGHHNELYRPVTQADIDNGNIAIGQKPVATIDELKSGVETKARACPAWFGNDKQGRICQKIKFNAKTANFCIKSGQPLLDLEMIEKYGLNSDGKIDLAKVRQAVKQLEQQLHSLQS